MSYIANLKNSFKYLATDLLEEYMPLPMKVVSVTKSALTSDVKRDLSTSGIMKSALTMINRLPYYNEAELFAKNSFKAIKTGKVYKSLGGIDDEDFDFGGMGGYTDYGMFDSGTEGDTSENFDNGVTNGEKGIMRSVIDSSSASVSSRNRQAKALHVDTKIMFHELTNTVKNTGEQTNSSLEGILKFNNDVMRTFVDNSLKYYTDSMNMLSNINKNLNKVANPEEKKGEAETWIDKFNKGDLWGGLKGLAWQGIDHLDSMGIIGLGLSMMDMTAQMYANNPTQVLKDLVGKGLDSMGLNNLAALQDDLMSNLGDKINSVFKKASMDKNKYVSWAGNAFRKKNGQESTIGAEHLKNEKQSVPWDTHSKMAVEVVIPGHLSRIEFLLSKMAGANMKSPMLYSYENTKWMDFDELYNKHKENSPNRKKEIEGIGDIITHIMSGSKHMKGLDRADTKKNYSAIMQLFTNALMENSFSFDDLTNMKYDDKDAKFTVGKLLKFNENPHLKSMFTEDMFNILKLEMEAAKSKNNGYNWFYQSAVERMDNYNKRAKEHRDETLKNIKQGGGMVNLYNDFGSTIPNFGAPLTREEAAKMNKDILYGTGFKGTNFDTRTIDEHFENVLQPNENTSYAPQDMAKIMSGDFKNLSGRALMGVAGFTNLTDEEKDKVNGKLNQINLLDALQIMASRTISDNEFTDKIALGEGSFFGRLKNNSAFNMENLLSDKVSNPLKDLAARSKLTSDMAKELVEDIEEESGEKLSDDKKSGVTEIMKNSLDDANRSFDNVDKNDAMSKDEKIKEKAKILRAKMSGAMDAIKGMLGTAGDKLGMSRDTQGKIKKIAKYSAMGIGGIIGANLLGGFLLPSTITAASGAFGMLTPVFLGGLGLAGAIWLTRKGIMKTLFNMSDEDMKDPEKMARLKGRILGRILPSGLLGIGSGAAASSILSASLGGFGAFMGPIVGAGVGIATYMLAYKKNIFNGLFGNQDGKDENGGKNAKKWLSIFGAAGLGAVGIGAVGKLLTAGAGTKFIGGILGMGGGIISAPLTIATGAIALGLLSQQKKFKAMLFGDENKEKGFFSNLKEFLFGDKKTNKSGILSRQFEKFSIYFDKNIKKMSNWFSSDILKPIKDGMSPFVDSMKGLGKSIVGVFMGGVDKM